MVKPNRLSIRIAIEVLSISVRVTFLLTTEIRDTKLINASLATSNMDVDLLKIKYEIIPYRVL